jgi:23S rRNA (uracil1939-C5)-methyltransferase
VDDDRDDDREDAELDGILDDGDDESGLRPGAQIEVRITDLGSHGDGIGSYEGRPVFVSHALPGDLVAATVETVERERIRARWLEIVEPGPVRVEPACPHFGPCGGCALQHMALHDYRGWKRGLVADILARNGFEDAKLAPMMPAEPRERRRTSWKLRATARKAVVGYMEAGSRHVVDVEHCLLLVPELDRLIPQLRAFMAGPEGYPHPAHFRDAHAEATEGGVDLVLTLSQAPDAEGLQALARFAETAGLARISWRPEPDPVPEPQRGGRGRHQKGRQRSPARGGPRAGNAPAILAEPEVVVRRQAPVVHRGGVALEPPPAGFAQATAAGEEALVSFVAGVFGHVIEEGGTIGDFFAGSGTFALALAHRGARVIAAEVEGPALEALSRAAAAAGLSDRVTVEPRDLMRWPPSARDLAILDAAVFDPPRAGARALTEQLAASGVPLIAAVSCNPVTFVRDAKILAAAGYRLVRVMPVDQFLWSRHVELAAEFRLDPALAAARGGTGRQAPRDDPHAPPRGRGAAKTDRGPKQRGVR